MPSESFAVPTDVCICLDCDERTAPIKQAAQRRHHPSRGIVGPAGFDRPLLEKGQLLPQKQILSR
jgi:hypothetical protein